MFFFTKKYLLPLLACQLLIAGCNGDPHQAGKVNPLKYSGMIYVPAGEFIMGTEPENEKEFPNTFGFSDVPYENEQPKRKVYIKGFYIDKLEVSIGEYVSFLRKTHRKPPIEWAKVGLDVGQFEKYPANYISWNDASAYAAWAGKKLPTEEQWEKAARGTDGRRYPWGNEFSDKKGNFSKKGTLPVGVNESDVSPFNVFDMGGNVAEWTRSVYKAYEGSSKSYKGNAMVYRGGTWGGTGGHYYLFSYFSRTAYRGTSPKDKRSSLLGFRCVIEE